MADNLKYNEPGSGPLVATDDVGSVHYQIMKLDIGKPDGSSIPIVGQIPVIINSGTLTGELPAGTQNIGDVDILTLPAVTQGAGSPIMANAWLMSGTLNISGIQTNDPVIKFIRVNATTDGDNTIISAVTGKKIRVLGYALTVTTAATITIQDTAGSPNIFAQFSLVAQGGVSYAGGLMCPAFESLVGNGIEINVAAGQDCLGHMSYLEV